MEQTDEQFRTNKGIGNEFTHSTLGKLIIAGGVLIILLIIALFTKPGDEKILAETYDNNLQCIADNDSIKNDKLDAIVNNFCNTITHIDTTEVHPDLREALRKYNKIEIYDHALYRTVYVRNNIHPDGVRIGFGIYGLVVPTVYYSDLLLDVGVLQNKYKDGVIRSIQYDDHDLGVNPNVKEYHYKGDPDQ